ncbi:MAG: LysR family transcriptional regulator [Solobacterium sp.]|nr:LysR family transcriptional regulator [Solobacterium sp.]
MATIRQLEIIVSVAEEKSITSAASKRFLSQPAVTKIINQVEKEYGVTLFQRVNRQLELTREGEAIIADANDILKRYYEMENKYKNHVLKNQVHIGLCNALLEETMHKILDKTRAEITQCSITIYQHITRYIDRSFNRGELDVIVMEKEPTSITHSEILVGDNTHVIAYNAALDSEEIRTSSLPYLFNNYKFALGVHGMLSRHLYDRYAVRTSALTTSPFYASSDYHDIIQVAKDYNTLTICPKRLIEKEIRSKKMKYFVPREEGFEDHFHVASRKDTSIKELPLIEKIVIDMVDQEQKRGKR